MGWADHRASGWLLAACAFVLAAAGARPHAASWNDGSRLASVESLVERGTFCIDDSVFLNPEAARGAPPYAPDDPTLARGTLDRLLIDGRWYSDKPPLVSVPLAAAYRGLMMLGAPAPTERPAVFAWAVCVLLSGTGCAVAVGCMWTLGRRAGLTPPWRLAWFAGFALATVLPAYTRSANNHIAQLGAVGAACVLLCRIADRHAEGRDAWGSLLAVGFVAGFAYNLDFGVGPPFVLAVLVAVALRTRDVSAVCACGLGALPLILAGHTLNYAIGGDFVKPLNMHPEYLSWPNSPFATTMTGVVRPRPVAQGLYALDLLFGMKGFLTHNPPLLLAAAAGALVLRRGARDRVELLALGAWCAAGWALYGVLSKNHGGGCVSVRWFVPFLAPGFWVLAKLLAERPALRFDFAALALCGLALAVGAWAVGPWRSAPLSLYWWTFGGSLVAWAAVRLFALRPKACTPAPVLTRAA